MINGINGFSGKPFLNMRR